MDFAVLPPEVNSGRMYVGAGAGPLVTAAAAWDAVAAELNSAATWSRSVVSELSGGPWVGRSSSLMVASVSPYVSWMSVTAAQAEQAAGQLGSVVAAYEAAFAATVPPVQVEVNRALLASLVATNILGQNTAAIASTEAQYAEMWAQDAAAMYGYAGACAVAARLTPFDSPPAATNVAATGGPSAVASRAAASVSGAGGAQSVLSQLISTLPSTLQTLAAGFGTPSLNPITWLEDALTSPTGTALNNFLATIGGNGLDLGSGGFLGGSLTFLTSPFFPLALHPPVAGLAGSSTALDGGLGSTLVGAGAPVGSGGGVAAGLGGASAVGKLSVPSSWVTAPGVRLVAAASPSADGLPSAATAGPAGPYGGMPPVGPVGGLINAPSSGQARAQTNSRTKALPPWAQEPATREHTPGGGETPSAPGGDQAISTREQLAELRNAIADVARQRDVLKRTAVVLMEEAAQK